jgi:hypothetical protein
MKMLKATDLQRYTPAAGADYPRSAFGQALKQIAQLAKANLGVEVAFAELGGWDTHINQGAAQGQLATRLDDFARGIAALTTDLGDRMEDTVVLTMSEFGRAISENGNRGTDHGHGNAMLVMGRPRERFGKWPDWPCHNASKDGICAPTISMPTKSWYAICDGGCTDLPRLRRRGIKVSGLFRVAPATLRRCPVEFTTEITQKHSVLLHCARCAADDANVLKACESDVDAETAENRGLRSRSALNVVTLFMDPSGGRSSSG